MAVGNNGEGILINGAIGSLIGLESKGVVNAVTISQGNIISGNDSAGISIVGTTIRCDSTRIGGNIIGIGGDTTTAIPNMWGITVMDAPNTLIGLGSASDLIHSNHIKENKQSGIMLFSDSCSVRYNYIENNGFVETPDKSSAYGDGVYVEGSANRICNLRYTENKIRYNNGVGVRIVKSEPNSSNYNRVRCNHIYGNVYGGIDLFPTGPNVNDALDADDGPNEGQNSPVILGASYAPNSRIYLNGYLHSEPNETYLIDYYINNTCDTNGLGQGEEWFFREYVTTSASGYANINFDNDAIGFSSKYFTLTATDSLGNTSEFSNCIEVVTSGVDVAIVNTDMVDTVEVQDTLIYNLTIYNVGPDTARVGTVVDSLPAQIAYVSHTSSHGTS
jgi:uncharacterized repeat protein (TIGR01451 family)